MPDPHDFFQSPDADDTPASPSDFTTGDVASDANTAGGGEGATSGASGGSDGTLELVKHGQRYVFDCPPGKEADTLARLAVLIEDDTNDLTWFDAALLCHQLGQRMGRKLSHLRRPA